MKEIDQSHLSTLAICQFVWTGIVAVFALLPIFHIAMGAMILSGHSPFPTIQQPGMPATEIPPEAGWFFVIMGSVVICLGEIVAGLNLLCALSLRKRKRRVLCLVVAGLNCLSVPFGTVLGVFTILVLSRPSVKELYESNKISHGIVADAPTREN